jgi:predicted ATPase/DNA-binding SARP family transcriptional activator
MADQLQISLFGGVQIIKGGKPVSGFISTKSQALLGYLAVTARPHSRDALAALLWGEMPEADAKTNLRQALANLRGLVLPHIAISRSTVEFDRSVPYSLDVEVFEQIGKFGASLPTTAEAATRLEEAVTLYRGNFLAGFHVRDAPEFEAWALARGEHFRAMTLEMLDVLTEYYTSTAAYAQAIACLRRSLSLEPWREETHRKLMLRLARTNQRSAALAQYETCRTILEKELNVSPSLETTTLYEKIRVAQTMTRHNLPPPSTPFVGRANELDLISKRLSDPACRLLTLMGPGGMGKTRLAMQTAERWSGIMLHGARFVSLAGVPANDSDLLILSIADAFDLYAIPSKAVQQLINYLRDKELLLVLDNFEHLVDVAPALAQFLEQAPNLKILVTSRLRLNVYGEQVFDVNEMGFPEENKKEIAAAELMEKYDSARLFVQSAQRAQMDFPVEENASHVTRICRLLRGLPLGIELAAAWINVMEAPAIADEIEKGFDFLTATQRGMPDRQKSLRVVFEHSWKMLTQAEQQIFARLSVFCGGFECAQAEIAANAPSEALRSLVNKSFLRRNADGRYELHHVLQSYGEEKLSLVESAAMSARERHAKVYGKFLSERESALKGAGLKNALEEINREIENIRVGWSWAVAQKRADIFSDYIEGLYQFYLTRSWLSEGAEAFGRARQMLDEEDEKIILARTMRREAKFLENLSQTERAVELLSISLAFLRASNEREETAAALNQLGVCSRGMGDFEKARTYLHESLSLTRDVWIKANALLALAGVEFRAGDSAEGRKFCEQSLECFRVTGDPYGIADCLVGMGIITQTTGEYEASRNYCEESLKVYRELGGQVNIALSLYNLGRLDHILKAFDGAFEHCEQSLAIRRELGDATGQIECLSVMGDIASSQKDHVNALKKYGEALRLAKSARTTGLLWEVVGKQTCILAQDPSPTKSQREKVLTLLCFVASHEECDGPTRGQAKKLQASFSAPFSAEKIRSMQNKGKNMTLEESLAELEDLDRVLA